MSKRNLTFNKEEYYHIYNRGTDKRNIFMDKGDIYYFFDALIISNQTETIENRNHDRNNSRKKIKQKIINNQKLVSIISYCLLPNHFHLILKEEVDGGISKFMSKIGASYVHYFNNKHSRSGSLFQGRFKATWLNNDNSLSLTSAYVNLNYKHHSIDPQKDLVKTSLFEFLGTEKGEKICNQKEIKNIIQDLGGIKQYKEYLKNQSKYFTEKHGNNPKNIKFSEL